MSATKRIGVIISSTRPSRIGAQIAAIIHKTLANSSDKTSLHLIDIRNFDLPIYDEPVMASKITSSEGYAHEHTRKWSREISSYQGFVFVTAQYNWSIPASLKNALDHLFNEWKAKPALIVSYGGHGGGKGADALTDICKGLRMKPFPETTQLSLTVREGFMNESQESGLPDDAEKLWHAELEKLKSIWPSFEQTLDGDNGGQKS